MSASQEQLFQQFAEQVRSQYEQAGVDVPQTQAQIQQQDAGATDYQRGNLLQTILSDNSTRTPVATTPEEIQSIVNDDPRTIPIEEGGRANFKEGAPFMLRLGAAFKFNATGVENFLRETEGTDNVVKNSEGELFYLPASEREKSPQQQTWLKFNPDGLDAGDVVELAPALLSGGLSAAFAGLTGGLGPLATGFVLFSTGAATEGFLQQVGKALPGDEEATEAQYLMRQGMAGTFDAALPGAQAAMSGVASAVKGAFGFGKRATESAAERVLRTGTAESAAAGREISRKSGVPLLLGEETGSTSIQQVTTLMERVPFVGEPIARARAKQLEVAAENYDKALAALGRTGTPEGLEAVYRKAASTWTKYVSRLGEARARAAEKNYGAISDSLGNAEVIRFDNTVAKIKEMLQHERLATASADDKRAETKRWLIEKMKMWSEEPPKKTEIVLTEKGRVIKAPDPELKPRTVNIKEFLGTLSETGKDSADLRRQADKLTDPLLRKWVSGELHKAMQADLQATANKFAGSPDIARMFDTARKSYSKYSNLIRKAKEHPLGKKSVQENPKAVIGKLVQKGNVLEANRILRFFDKVDPAVGLELRAEAIANRLGMTGKTAKDAFALEQFSPVEISRLAKASSSEMATLLKGLPGELGERVASLNRAMSRITAAARQRNSSPTAFYQSTLAAAMLLASSDVSAEEKMSWIQSSVATLFSARMLATALTNPKAISKYSLIINEAAKGAEKMTRGKAKAVMQAVWELLSLQPRADRERKQQEFINRNRFLESFATGQRLGGF